ncbi:tyrosine-type recombinase/integrase [Nannocystis sp.]|uniref:tyrosine-type recombinase/integrase n=1 Tax=Nannocystis sp. TaxID=1962667 RepID=UPI0025D8DC65|nr:tyrosine-type recombinase/integrase [Nannocystis sp.]MBK7827231.1 tyrosine-type recombinase/integrase [Nannocystis sp.]
MLTNTKAREAKPKSARYEITCDALPGFILRVLPTGKKVFFVRYRDAEGKDHRERLGLMVPGYGVDEARRAAMKVLAHAGDADATPEPSPRHEARAARSEPSAPRVEERPVARTTRPAPPVPHVVEPTARATRRPVARTAEPELHVAEMTARTTRRPTSRVAKSPRSAEPSPPRSHPAPDPKPAVTAPEPEPAPAPRRAPVLTLAAFTERFIEEHVNVYLKGETARHYKSSLRNHILPALGSKPLDEISTADIERLHRSLAAKRSTANYARTVLSVVFAKAERWDVTTRRNPAQRAARFEERAVERFLSPDERKRLETLLTDAATHKPCQPGYIQPDAIWAIRLLALTGMRHSEICDLKWDQVDWNRGILRLPDSKTGKRDVVVSDQVIALLREIAMTKKNPKRGRVVCSRTGDKLHSLGRTWRRLRELVGMPDLRIHDLRHSVASDAIMQGVPLEVVGKMLGHRNYKTTQRYAHIADTALRDAVNLTSKTILQSSRGPT